MGKDEIQAGRSFLSNRCEDQWQIPWDAQVAPETTAIIYSTNAPTSFHKWNELPLSPPDSQHHVVYSDITPLPWQKCNQPLFVTPTTSCLEAPPKPRPQVSEGVEYSGN